MRRTLIAPTLAIALIATVAPATLQIQDVAFRSATECKVSDDEGLNQQSSPTADGHYPHEEWVANPGAQRVVEALGNAVERQFGASSKTDPDAALGRGLVGIALDHHTQSYVVVADSRNVDAPGLQRRLEATSKSAAGNSQRPLNVRVIPSCHSSSSLAHARDVIRGRAWHSSAATATFSSELNPYTSTYEVSFDATNSEAGAALEAQLGDLVDVTYGDAARAGRMDDGEPHYGGAGIRASSQRYNTCTSGFTVVLSNGTRGAVTAGHCYLNGVNVYSGPQYYGVTSGRVGYPLWDMERIHPNRETFSPKIHVDPCCPSVRTVTGDGPVSVGQYICASGMVTKAICGLEIRSTSAYFCDEDGCTTSLLSFRRGGVRVVRPGDSGGPMYSRPTSTSARIHGMVIAGVNYGYTGLAEKVAGIKSHLGVSVAR